MKKIIKRLNEENILDLEEIVYIFENLDEDGLKLLMDTALIKAEKFYGNNIYLRGLIEFSNHCNRKCYYCGISAYNSKIERFRLSEEEIYNTAVKGYKLGFRTFVLQGGEDSKYEDEIFVNIIRRLKAEFKDIAITLSLGEKDYNSYKSFYEAGADRYLLRHESISKELFEKIHKDPNYERRIDSLFELKEIGYQVGTGFMVGVPKQTYLDLAKDILFIKELNPEMVGLGPYIVHKDSIFKDEKSGSLRDTLICLALIRHMVPDVLLPATTALSTLDERGRELGFKAGANVIMPNLSPANKRDLYSLYDNKLSTGLESSEELEKIKTGIKNLGFQANMNKGDSYRRR